MDRISTTSSTLPLLAALISRDSSSPSPESLSDKLPAAVSSSGGKGLTISVCPLPSGRASGSVIEDTNNINIHINSLITYINIMNQM